MKSYWCFKKNDMAVIMANPGFNLAPDPCKKAECELWNEKEMCFYCRVSGK